METPADGSQVGLIGENSSGGDDSATIDPLEGGGAVLAELARAVEHDLATSDDAPATERANAHDWADFSAFLRLAKASRRRRITCSSILARFLQPQLGRPGTEEGAVIH